MDVPSRVIVGGNSRVAFCVCQLYSKTDEDRFSYHLAKDDPSTTNISHFGMFDGHGGNFAGQKLADVLHDEVLKRYNKGKDMEKNFDDEKIDSVFCESFRTAVSDVDRLIRNESTAGSTQVSIFAFALPDGSTRVLCPWIGDSRCVMYQVLNGKENTFQMSIDHKPTLPRERKRIERRESIVWTGAPMEVNAESSGQTINESSVSGKRVAPIRELPGQFHDIEDYSQHERDGVTVVPLGKTVWSIDYDDGIEEGLEEEKLEDASEPEVIAEEETRPAIVTFQSFIDRRSLPGGPKNGPYAVFGRYGTSLAMTRSIGDKFGPRSCVAIPEISASSIPPMKFARFVIGSDGLWDVVSNEVAQNIALSIPNAKLAAYKLARMAHDIRVFKEMRMDDVTVIVVDINPTCFEQPVNAGCNCTIS